MDRLVDWWESVKERFAHITTLLINLDNGPESHSRRTEVSCSASWTSRSTFAFSFVWPTILPITAAYNSIERGFGILEQHWNGALLDSVDAVIQYARAMTWKGNHPEIALVTTTYHTGVKLTRKAMDLVETQLQRLPSLGKWFVDIDGFSPAHRDG